MRCFAFYRTGNLARRARRAHASHEDATMPQVKQASKQKRATKAAIPALGAAGLSIGRTNSGHPADDALHAERGNDARRGRNGRR
jgi:hypothetical protein